jgi:two-component system nitrogen regulation sensor histidine kinase NtrY
MTGSHRESITDQIQLLVGGHMLTLLVNISLLRDSDGHYLGMVLVFDDLTELIRVQKLAAWRDVAQGIAHEIKNPLSPIQLSAQRLRRKYRERSGDLDEIFDECTSTIITQVEGLKGLLDEFSKFARLPESNPTPTDLPQLLEEVLHLYRGVHRDIEIVIACDPPLSKVNLDGEQMKRALINLIENALEAMDGTGRVDIVTSLDTRHQRVCCSCPILRRKSRDRDWDWRLCSASSPITTATSQSATTPRGGPSSRSSFRWPEATGSHSQQRRTDAWPRGTS